MTPQHPAGYRPDIDGLRAVAVVSVILFHFGVTRFAGGFVGVDVFFVISGYLITGFILADLEAQRFSFARFYLRRARRLLPALFFTLAVSLAVGAVLFTPEHLILAARSLVASLVSVSNVQFWRESGYFDADAHLKPLLHTWSLSVEEQFYLVWPVTAALLFRLGGARLLLAFLVVSALASLAAAERWLGIDRSATFYLTPFRVTELAIGALCVWAVRVRPRRRWLMEVAVGAGVVAIGWSIATFTEATPFPGRYALIPCLGTAAIIWGGRESRLGALIGNRLAVGTGLISYSLYLAHWPIYVFYRYWKLEPLTRWDRLNLIAASFGVAVLMYFFVERPFRVPPGTTAATRPARFVLACATVAALIAIPAGSAWLGGGWSWRVPADVARASGDLESFRADRDRSIRLPECHMVDGYDRFESSLPRCLARRSGKLNILVIGDSHAADLWSALSGAYPEVNFMQATGAACKPVEGWHAGDRHPCRRLLRYVKQEISEQHDLDGIVLSARWKGRLRQLQAEIDSYRALGVPVAVFGPVAEYDPPIRMLAHRHGSMQRFGDFAERHRVDRVTRLDAEMRHAFGRSGTPYVSKIDVYCGRGACPLVGDDGRLLIQDYGHWGVAAARLFGRELARRYDTPLAIFARD